MSLTKSSYSMIVGAPVNLKDFGAVGDGIVDDTSAWQSAILYAATNKLQLYAPAPSAFYKITSNITVNCNFDAGLYRVFGGAGTVIFGNGSVDGVRPEWWGAVPDGTTDCQGAITSAINSLLNTNSEVILLKFTSGIYYVATPVEIFWQNYSTNGAGIRFEGTAAIQNFNQKGTRFTGGPGIESVFVHRAQNTATIYFMSFQCRNITFLSGNLGTTGPQSAIKVIGGGQSSRPFIIEECYFSGFDAAIRIDATPTNASLALAIFNKNFFINNNYSVYGTGTAATYSFVFTNNQAGTGGSVKVNLEGSFYIADNVMESNPDSIYITGGQFAGEVARNYYEANSGYLAYFSSTTPKSTVTIKDQMIGTVSGVSIQATNVQLQSLQNVNNLGTRLRINSKGKSFINNEGIVYPTNVSFGGCCLDINSVSLSSSLAPASLTNAGYSAVSVSTEKTPLGTVGVKTISGSSAPISYALTAAIGDWVVFQCLARIRANNFDGFFVEVLNNAGTVSIGVSDTNDNLTQIAIGEWVYIMKYVYITAGSGGNIQWYWNTSNAATSVDVTDTYIYKVVGASTNSPIYLWMPPV